MERVRGVPLQSAKRNAITRLIVEGHYPHALNSKERLWTRGSIYRVVFQRLFEEKVTEDLLTILGHLVLLWFTGDTQTRRRT